MFDDDRNLRRVFQEMFCVKDIAVGLHSFDDTGDGDQVKSVMVAKGLDVVGVRRCSQAIGLNWLRLIL